MAKAGHEDFVALRTGPTDLATLSSQLPSLDELSPQGFGWMVAKAAASSSRDFHDVLKGIGGFRDFGFPAVGAEAQLYERTVGTCLLLPIDADQCVAQVAGFFVEPELWGKTGISLLERVIAAAKELTMSRIVALADSDTSMRSLLVQLGFVATGREETVLVGDHYPRVTKRAEYRLAL